MGFIARARQRFQQLVERFAQLSGRSLRPTTSGRWIIGLALAVGFAAMNTGNNLLFFGWGLVLSSIVISGILSESTLRAATPTPLPPDELRAGLATTLPVQLDNTQRVPAFGVAVSVILRRIDDGGGADLRSGATFELRLSPGTTRTANVPLLPRRRGQLAVQSVRVATAAPFGFFAKERILDGARLPLALRSLLVLPERVDTRVLGHSLWARLGELPAGQAGTGDELFSLRPYREGDDPRRIAWKRAAKTGRLVIRENEATQSRELVVDLRIGETASVDDVEDAVATAASLIEDLLELGHSVGVRAAGLNVPSVRSPRQRDACLRALATWKPGSATSAALRSSTGIIAIVCGNASGEHADVVVKPMVRPSRSTA